MEILENEENYLTLSELHIVLKPIMVLADLQEVVNGEK